MDVRMITFIIASSSGIAGGALFSVIASKLLKKHDRRGFLIKSEDGRTEKVYLPISMSKEDAKAQIRKAVDKKVALPVSKLFIRYISELTVSAGMFTGFLLSSKLMDYLYQFCVPEHKFLLLKILQLSLFVLGVLLFIYTMGTSTFVFAKELWKFLFFPTERSRMKGGTK